jgi:hypothetical protein
MDPVMVRGAGVIVLGLEVAVAAIDGLDAVEDLAVEGGAQELEVLGVSPDERTG